MKRGDCLIDGDFFAFISMYILILFFILSVKIDFIYVNIAFRYGLAVWLIKITYSRYGKVQGTNAIWEEEGAHINIEGRTQLHYWEDFGPILEEYEHPLWRKYQKQGVREA